MLDLVGGSNLHVVIRRADVAANGLLHARSGIDVVLGQQVVHLVQHFRNSGEVTSAVGATVVATVTAPEGPNQLRQNEQGTDSNQRSQHDSSEVDLERSVATEARAGVAVPVEATAGSVAGGQTKPLRPVAGRFRREVGLVGTAPVVAGGEGEKASK